MTLRSIPVFLWCLWFFPAGAQHMSWSRLSEDTVYYAREYFPEFVSVGGAGPGQVWDLRFLKAPFAIQTRITPIGDRDQKSFGFLQTGKETEAVLELLPQQALAIQQIRTNPFCPGMRLTFSQQPAQRLFFKGVLGATDAYKGRLVATFAWPRDLTCKWRPDKLPDSCRMTVTLHEDIVVDASGTLFLPTESASVLRQRVTRRLAYNFMTLDHGQWTDISTTVSGFRLYRQEERVRFVDAISGVLLAEAELDGEGLVESIRFKTHPLITRILAEEPVNPDILAYPNPSYGSVRFQLRDLSSGPYRLKIFNILGVAVREIEIPVDHPRETISVDLGDLQRGTYLYRLQEPGGRTLRTKKLVLIAT